MELAGFLEDSLVGDGAAFAEVKGVATTSLRLGDVGVIDPGSPLRGDPGLWDGSPLGFGKGTAARGLAALPSGGGVESRRMVEAARTE